MHPNSNYKPLRWFTAEEIPYRHTYEGTQGSKYFRDVPEFFNYEKREIFSVYQKAVVFSYVSYIVFIIGCFYLISFSRFQNKNHIFDVEEYDSNTYKEDITIEKITSHLYLSIFFIMNQFMVCILLMRVERRLFIMDLSYKGCTIFLKKENNNDEDETSKMNRFIMSLFSNERIFSKEITENLRFLIFFRVVTSFFVTIQECKHSLICYSGLPHHQEKQFAICNSRYDSIVYLISMAIEVFFYIQFLNSVIYLTRSHFLARKKEIEYQQGNKNSNFHFEISENENNPSSQKKQQHGLLQRLKYVIVNIQWFNAVIADIVYDKNDNQTEFVHNEEEGNNLISIFHANRDAIKIIICENELHICVFMSFIILECIYILLFFYK